MSLIDYIKKRNFSKTSEPKGTKPHRRHAQSIFVIQKHDASHLHFDFRLEVKGVLKSWAVPKGPSLNPKDKRLAMMVEDHPFSYRSFEGTIPKGSYGAGEVIVWDNGTYTVDGTDSKNERDAAMLAGIKKGSLKIVLHGQKLNGKFALVKMHGTDDKAWLLIKEHDEFENANADLSDASVLSDQQLSVDLQEEKASSQTKLKPTKKALPQPFSPMLATLVDKPFSEEGWIFEPKLDGYRTLAFVNKHQVELYSRNQKLLNKKFPRIVEALEKLPIQAVIDGEVVGLNADGDVDFQLLQNASEHQEKLRYCTFDLLFLEGHDLTQLPLTDRKKLLQKAVDGLNYTRFVESVSDGKKLFQQAASKGYEGIIAKKSDSIYRPNTRSDEWLKIKVTHTQDAIICGYTQPQGQRGHFGSLLLGIYQDNILHYVGHTGTGFNTRDLTDLKKLLDKNISDHSPFDSLPDTVSDAHVTWLKPQVVCEVKYAQWTHDNILRHAVYQRLRDDKDPKSVQLEHPEETKNELKHAHKNSQKIYLTHPDKIYWPKLGLTKADLLAYYGTVSPTILPYLKQRPESLNRQPNGISDDGFFQKDITFDTPDFVDLATIDSDDAGKIRYLVCNNQQTLLYMANLGCIEINPWNSRVGSLDCPDYFVIDLDPLDVPFAKVVQVAKTVKKILDRAKMTAYCKTSGKRGIHIFIPLNGKYETELSANFAKLIATLTFQELPEITSLERSPNHRQGKVYVDFLQNRKGQTLAAPYSLRPTAEATASTPLQWDELNSSLDPKKFTIHSLPKRIKKLGDVWDGILDEKNNLQKALENLQK